MINRLCKGKVNLMLKSFFCAVFVVLAIPALSKSIISGLALPDGVNDELSTQSFLPVGETTFSILFWDLYKSKLLTTSGAYPIDPLKDKLVYKINYLADISSEDLLKPTVEQWQHVDISPKVYEGYLRELKSIWPDIKDGDNLSLLILPNRSVFYFNDKYIGVINDDKFGELFLAIWLSEKTSEPKLRRELLGQKS